MIFSPRDHFLIIEFKPFIEYLGVQTIVWNASETQRWTKKLYLSSMILYIVDLLMTSLREIVEVLIPFAHRYIVLFDHGPSDDSFFMFSWIRALSIWYPENSSSIKVFFQLSLPSAIFSYQYF